MVPSEAVRAAMAMPSSLARRRSSLIIARRRPRRRCDVRTVTDVTIWDSSIRPNPILRVLRKVAKVATGTVAGREDGATAPVW
ncbi:hypothetical protein NCCP2145_02260 [Pseudarthrobacter sp. NCCP-2145]|nr:hypothetical protein NCCP2145_02260 [Pseudarthrobacter sp. NCCP-2145]